MIVNSASLLAKGPPHLGWPAIALSVGALGVGLPAGALLSRRLNPERARALVLVIAVVGAAATVVKGILGWNG